jgi:hypothetical protein
MKSLLRVGDREGFLEEVTLSENCLIDKSQAWWRTKEQGHKGTGIGIRAS